MKAKSTSLNGHQKALLIASAVSVVLAFVPYLRVVLLPLTYLNTHIHELMHALATVVTGGSADSITVFSNGEGVTPVRGGVLLIIASAGYVGSATLGAAIIASCRTGQAAQYIARGLAAALCLSMIIWVRGDLVGFISGMFWIAALVWIQGIKDQDHRMFAVQFIGVQQCLNATMSIRDLLILSAKTSVPTDAVLLQNATGLPSIVWAVLWAGIGIVGVVTAGRSVFRT